LLYTLLGVVKIMAQIKLNSKQLLEMQEKAKKYKEIKTKISDLFYSEDESIDLTIIGEEICSLLGFYGD
jgi:hypothetical protein